MQLKTIPTVFFRSNIFRLASLFTFTVWVIWVNVFDLRSDVSGLLQPNDKLFASASNVLLRGKKEFDSGRKNSTINVTSIELNALFGVASSKIKSLNAAAKLYDESLEIRFSYQFNYFSGWFLNGSLLLVDGKGLDYTNIYFGNIPIPPWVFRYFIHRKILREAGGNAIINIINSIQSLHFQPDSVEVSYLQTQLDKDLGVAFQKQGQLQLSHVLIDPNKVNGYLRKLIAFSKTSPSNTLNTYLNYLFLEISLKSDIKSLSEEQKSALLALTLFSDSSRLHLLIPSDAKLASQHDRSLLLQGRSDLTKHFLISASIKIISNDIASDSIGVAKETLDSSTGGSGFSFKDLAADRAGIRLAELVINKPEALQTHIESTGFTLTNANLLPSINGLEEGLNEKEFRNKYTNTESAEYKDVIKLIDIIIESNDLYRIK
ncbi:MAG: hypothetical protein ACI93R_002912 [Flavobacteriales bacterium]|jgi:hypothetical protein